MFRPQDVKNVINFFFIAFYKVYTYVARKNMRTRGVVSVSAGSLPLSTRLARKFVRDWLRRFTEYFARWDRISRRLLGPSKKAATL